MGNYIPNELARKGINTIIEYCRKKNDIVQELESIQKQMESPGLKLKDLQKLEQRVQKLTDEMKRYGQ